MSIEEIHEDMRKLADKIRELDIQRESIKFEIDEYTYSIAFAKIKTPTLGTEGMSSIIFERLAHVLFLDYDGVEQTVAEQDAIAVQEIYECGNFYIFKTDEHNFHAVCLDYFTIPEVQDIQRISNCDRAYYRGPLYNFHRGWVLRTEPKGDKGRPQFIKVMESPYEGVRPQSTFHATLINDRHGTDIVLTSPDGITTGYIDKYDAVVAEEGE